MRRDTAWLFVFMGMLFALLLIIAYIVNGFFVDSTNNQYSLGALIGIGFGIGIVGLIKTHWWKDNLRWIIHIIMLVWEGFILAFTIYYMFPHVGKEVFQVGENISLNNLQPYYILDAFGTDIKNCWYIYALFFFAIFVWLILLVPYEQEKNKLRNRYKIFQISLLIFSAVCITTLLFLRFKQILPNEQYKFFDKDPFWFSLFIGISGITFIANIHIVFFCIKKGFFWVKSLFYKPMNSK